MAQDITKATPAVANVGARIDLIKKLDSELRPLEAEIDAINVKKKQLRKTFTADTQITMADFDAARRLAMIDDDEERHGKIDNYREVYNALKPGEQLSWLDAMEAKGSKSNGPGDPEDIKAAIFGDAKKMDVAGHTAGSAGAGAETCPVDEDHENHGAWNAGWDRAQAEMAAKLGEGAAKH